MTLVGVVSDTHGHISPYAVVALAECDVIIHAGDIGGPEIIRELEVAAPVIAVLGNNDYDEYGSSVTRFARPCIGGVRFLIAHYPRHVHFTAFGSHALAPGDPIPDICIHGHTHIPQIVSGKEVRPARFVLCPGSVSRPRGYPPSVAFIQVDEGKVMFARIETLDGEILYQWPD